jgi:hypothetical protein
MTSTHPQCPVFLHTWQQFPRGAGVPGWQPRAWCSLHQRPRLRGWTRGHIAPTGPPRTCTKPRAWRHQGRLLALQRTQSRLPTRHSVQWGEGKRTGEGSQKAQMCAGRVATHGAQQQQTFHTQQALWDSQGYGCTPSIPTSTEANAATASGAGKQETQGGVTGRFRAATQPSQVFCWSSIVVKVTVPRTQHNTHIADKPYSAQPAQPTLVTPYTGHHPHSTLPQ